jgi:hypothetical protein
MSGSAMLTTWPTSQLLIKCRWAKPVDRVVDHGLHVGLLRHVGADEAGVRSQTVLKGCAFGSAAAGSNDLCTFLQEHFSYPFTNTGRSAGDDGDLSGQSTHISLR